MRLRRAVGLAAGLVACTGAPPPTNDATGPVPAPTSSASGAIDAPDPEPAGDKELTDAEIEALMKQWAELTGPKANADEYRKADDETRWYLRSCIEFARPMMHGIENARAKGAKPGDLGGVMMEIFKELEAKGVGDLTPQTIKRCANEMIRGVRAYMIGVRLAQPKADLSTIGFSMKRRYEDNKKLCPATTKPVPEHWDKAKERYISKPSDYAAATWKCLLFNPGEGESRFQYSVAVDHDKGTFVATGIGSVTDDGKKQTYTVSGRVEGGVVVYDEDAKGPTPREIAKDIVPIP